MRVLSSLVHWIFFPILLKKTVTPLFRGVPGKIYFHIHRLQNIHFNLRWWLRNGLSNLFLDICDSSQTAIRTFYKDIYVFLNMDVSIFYINFIFIPLFLNLFLDLFLNLFLNLLFYFWLLINNCILMCIFCNFFKAKKNVKRKTN